MAKQRERIPAKIREEVLKEYRHLCAKCGGVGPQLHHINEDPSNNDLMNLIPLCPNCHLTDQHNPTQRIEPGKLRLFRQYKDPAILSPQFHALYRRAEFLDTLDSDDALARFQWLGEQTLELIAFVESLEMGEYYGKRLSRLMLDRKFITDELQDRQVSELQYDFHIMAFGATRGLILRDARDQVYDLLIELLRFQRWNVEG